MCKVTDVKRPLREDEEQVLATVESRERLNVAYREDKIALLLRDRLIQERELSETRRALLEELEWLDDHHTDPTRQAHLRCRICFNPKTWGHKPDCAIAIATALQGVGGE